MGKNLQSIGKMEEALSGKEIVDTGQRSKIELGGGDHQNVYSVDNFLGVVTIRLDRGKLESSWK